MSKQICAMDWAITVSGACKSYNGPELIATLDHTEYTHDQAARERDSLSKTCGRILYLSRVCDLPTKATPPQAGNKILADDGMVGIITEARPSDRVVFARPSGVPYKQADIDGVTGVPNAVLIMATAWTVNADGSLTGMWATSPLHTRLTARLI